jgi:hypothetical protein
MDGEWMTARLNEAEWGEELRSDRPSSFGVGWDDIEIEVDGRPTPASTRSHNSRSALLVDLPTVAVTVTGSESRGSSFTPLRNVDDSLDRYV